MKKILLVVTLLCVALSTFFCKASDQPARQTVVSRVVDLLRYCFTTKDGFNHVVHKAALTAIAFKGGFLLLHVPQKNRLFGAGALLYGLWLSYNFKIKKFKSEAYFENGVGEELEQYILNFLPVEEKNRSLKVKSWMENPSSHTTLLRKITQNINGYDRAAMKAQLDKDIVALGDWYVPCSSAWNWCRRTLNGGSANYSMQNIDDFSTKEIEGADLGFLNLLDLRYGSSAYKRKMMKMVLLRKLLDLI